MTAKYIIKGKRISRHKWVWGINKKDEDKINRLAILNMAEIKPVIHPLLKLNKNPYLLKDKEYFERRIINKSSSKFRDTIYKRYNHFCPLCEESLHNGEKVELHHIIPVKEGGKYTLKNIQPLHQQCHISVTHKKMTKESNL